MKKFNDQSTIILVDEDAFTGILYNEDDFEIDYFEIIEYEKEAIFEKDDLFLNVSDITLQEMPRKHKDTIRYYMELKQAKIDERYDLGYDEELSNDGLNFV